MPFDHYLHLLHLLACGTYVLRLVLSINVCLLPRFGFLSGQILDFYLRWRVVIIIQRATNAVRALIFAVSGKTKDQAEVELSMLRKFDFLCPEELKPKLKTALGEQGKAKAKAKGKAGAKKQDMEQAEVDALSVFS